MAKTKGRKITVTLCTTDYAQLAVFARMSGMSVGKFCVRAVKLYLGFLNRRAEEAADERIKDLAKKGVTISVGLPKEVRDGDN